MGSELARVSADSSHPPVRIRVTRVNGLSQSEARVVGGAGSVVEVGDLFEIAKWVPGTDNPLRVWVGFGNLNARLLSDVVHEAATLSASHKIDWVSDPATRSATYMISWDSTKWVLTKAGTANKISLGPKLRAQDVLAQLPAVRSPVFLKLPPPTTLAQQLIPEPGASPIVLANDPEMAKYVLTGTYAHNSVAYTWVRKDVIEQGHTLSAGSKNVSQHEDRAPYETSVCSADSPYPVRADWVQWNDAEAEQAGNRLRELSVQLARIRQWLELPTPPSSGTFPFQLAIKSGDSFVTDRASGGQHATLHLVSDRDIPARLIPRWFMF